MKENNIFGLDLNGPFVKQLSNETWYGSFGGCNICGEKREGFLIPRAVRWWDPDDGWKHGVLCRPCMLECSERGPRKSDYAYKAEDFDAEFIDAAFSLGDNDGAHSDLEDLFD